MTIRVRAGVARESYRGLMARISSPTTSTVGSASRGTVMRRCHSASPQEIATPKSRHLGAHVFLSVEEGLSLGDRHVEHGGDVLDVTTSFPKGESPGPGTSGWYDPFACCLDIIDTDREDTHGIDDANPLQGPVTLPGEPSDGLAGDVREEGDDSPWDATFMNEGTDVKGEIAGVDPCCRRCRGL